MSTKFRAWDAERKVMVYGDEIEEYTEEVDEISYTVDCPRYMTGLSYGVPFVAYTNKSGDFTECKLMQSVRLRDKNGREVYEGDVIKGSDPSSGYEDGAWVVRWWPERCRFILCNGGTGVEDSAKEELVIRETAQIIGNIHENPELLT